MSPDGDNCRYGAATTILNTIPERFPASGREGRRPARLSALADRGGREGGLTGGVGGEAHSAFRHLALHFASHVFLASYISSLVLFLFSVTFDVIALGMHMQHIYCFKGERKMFCQAPRRGGALT